MMEGVTRRMMMLRPMQAGLSGYARLQEEAGWQLVQINLRGLQGGGMRAFWYAGEGLVRELGRSAANARGEAALSAELPVDPASPGRLTALLIADDSDKPRPLAIGLCAAQSAGSLMDAKNALLALCDRLGRMAEEERAAKAAADKAASPGSTAAEAGRAPSAAGPEGCGKGDLHGGSVAEPCGQAAAPQGIQQNDALQPPPVSASCDSAGDSPAPQTQPKRLKAPLRRKNRPSSPPEPTREVFLPAIEARRPPRRRRGGRPEEPKQSGLTETDDIAREESVGSAAAACCKPSASGCTETPHRPGGAVCGRLSADPPAADPPAANHSAASSLQAGLSTPEASPASDASAMPPAPPADLLPSLRWPAPYESLAGFFHRYPPVGLMNWPGWRFVHVPGEGTGMWIGCRQQDGLVRQVAYALPAEAEPPRGGAFRPARSALGYPIQLLVLECGEQIFPSAGIRTHGSEIV